MSRFARLALLASSLLGGCTAGDVGTGVGVVRAPILDGTPNPGDPSVVLLIVGDAMCTGSVIDPYVILTARHCTAGIDPQTVEVYTGADPLMGDGQPVAYRGDITAVGVPDDEGDIAIFQSGVDLGLTPLPFSRDLTNPGRGDTITAIGYGQGDDYGGEGPKRRGQGTVEDVYLDAFVTTAVTCFGDSGGPIFDDAGTIVGVVSAGTADQCSTGQDLDVNVGYYGDFLDGYVGQPDPSPDPDPQPDPDPDPQPDPDPGPDPVVLGALGDACSEAAECESNACVVGDGYCTEACAGDDCPDGFECKGVGAEFYCVLGGAGGGGGSRARSSCAVADGPAGAAPSGAYLIAGLAGLGLIRRRRARAASAPRRP